MIRLAVLAVLTPNIIRRFGDGLTKLGPRHPPDATRVGGFAGRFAPCGAGVGKSKGSVMASFGR